MKKYFCEKQVLKIHFTILPYWKFLSTPPEKRKEMKERIHVSFKPKAKTRKINHAVRIDYETLSSYSFLLNRHTVHFKLKLLKFTSNQYHPLTVMDRTSFERPCSKSITATYTIFNRECTGVDLKDI